MFLFISLYAKQDKSLSAKPSETALIYLIKSMKLETLARLQVVCRIYFRHIFRF